MCYFKLMNTYIEYWKTLSNLRVANWCLEICSPLTSMRTISRDMIHCRTGHKETYHITPYRIISRHDAAHLGIAYHMHTYNRTCTYTVLYMSIYLSICVYIYIYIHIYIHIHVYICVCVWTHVHSHRTCSTYHTGTRGALSRCGARPRRCRSEMTRRDEVVLRPRRAWIGRMERGMLQRGT